MLVRFSSTRWAQATWLARATDLGETHSRWKLMSNCQLNSGWTTEKSVGILIQWTMLHTQSIGIGIAFKTGRQLLRPLSAWIAFKIGISTSGPVLISVQTSARSWNSKTGTESPCPSAWLSNLPPLVCSWMIPQVCPTEQARGESIALNEVDDTFSCSRITVSSTMNYLGNVKGNRSCKIVVSSTTSPSSARVRGSMEQMVIQAVFFLSVNDNDESNSTKVAVRC